MYVLFYLVDRPCSREEGGRERGREGGREGGMEGGMDGGMEGGGRMERENRKTRVREEVLVAYEFNILP